MSDGGEPASIEDWNDVGKNGFCDDRRDEREEPGNQTDADYGRVVERPTLLDGEFEQVEQFKRAIGQTGVAGKGVG